MRMGQKSTFCVWFIITFTTQIVIKVTRDGSKRILGNWSKLTRNRVNAGLMSVSLAQRWKQCWEKWQLNNYDTSINVGPLLAHHLQCWTINGPTLDRCVVFTGISPSGRIADRSDHAPNHAYSSK